MELLEEGDAETPGDYQEDTSEASMKIGYHMGREDIICYPTRKADA